MQTPSRCISSNRLSKNVQQATPISTTACPFFSQGNTWHVIRAIVWFGGEMMMYNESLLIPMYVMAKPVSKVIVFQYIK